MMSAMVTAKAMIGEIVTTSAGDITRAKKTLRMASTR